MVALMYASSVFGNLTIGWLSDRYPAGWVVFGACSIAALSTWTLWGWGTSDALLITFCLVWGFTGQSTAAAWTKMISYMAGECDPVAVLTTQATIRLCLACWLRFRQVCVALATLRQVSGGTATLLIPRPDLHGSPFHQRAQGCRRCIRFHQLCEWGVEVT